MESYKCTDKTSNVDCKIKEVEGQARSKHKANNFKKTPPTFIWNILHEQIQLLSHMGVLSTLSLNF
jgi:hypothetical protein